MTIFFFNVISDLLQIIIIYHCCFYSCSWLARTDPADVARVESLTFMCTPNKRDTLPFPKEGVKGMLGNWLSPEDMEKAFNERFPGCMKGWIYF